MHHPHDIGLVIHNPYRRNTPLFLKQPNIYNIQQFHPMWIKILPQNKMNGEGITLISSERPLFLLGILAACYIFLCPYLLHFFLYISSFFILTCISNFLHVSCWCTWVFCSRNLQYFRIKQVTLSIYREAILSWKQSFIYLFTIQEMQQNGYRTCH
jgi:hypothetical protein